MLDVTTTNTHSDVWKFTVGVLAERSDINLAEGGLFISLSCFCHGLQSRALWYENRLLCGWFKPYLDILNFPAQCREFMTVPFCWTLLLWGWNIMQKWILWWPSGWTSEKWKQNLLFQEDLASCCLNPPEDSTNPVLLLKVSGESAKKRKYFHSLCNFSSII